MSELPSHTKFTRAQAAQYLGVSLSFLAGDVVHQKHKIPFIKIGSRVQYPKDLLDKWIKQHTHNDPADAADA